MYCTALLKEHFCKGQVWFHGTALHLGLSKVEYILSNLLPLFTALRLLPSLWSEGVWLVLHKLIKGWPWAAWGASQPHSWWPRHPPAPQCTGALSQHVTHWHTPHSISLPAGQLHFLQKTLWVNEHQLHYSIWTIQICSVLRGKAPWVLSFHTGLAFTRPCKDCKKALIIHFSEQAIVRETVNRLLKKPPLGSRLLVQLEGGESFLFQKQYH